MSLGRINVLDKNTSNKIAAGEVVERPFSVVKELLENSLDANAKSIVMEINEGGQKLIKITDDGVGIHPDDIEKAFLPHATSKISSIDDIFKLSTMGFRGEALASISSVSKVTLKSKIKDLDFGRELHIEGGNIHYLKDTGSNNGTTIEVRDLFYNVPARLKFLKSSSREASLISDIVQRLALAHPDVSFKLINNEKTVLHSFGTGDIKDVIRNVYGKNVLENVINFESHKDIISVHGFIGNREISRGSRNHQSIFVNKRYIKSRLITTAVENAFKSFLTINKYPFFILFIDIFPEYVDVNVHPTKTEVKFKDEREIFGTVFHSVHEAIKNSVINSFNIEEEVKETEKEIRSIETFKLPIDFLNSSDTDSLSTNFSEKTNNININSNFNKEYTEEKEAITIKAHNDNFEEKSSLYIKEEPLKKEQTLEAPKLAKLPEINIIGQFNKTYILGEIGDDLYIIDQHAAHEKILFETYSKNIAKQQVISQILISPVIIELLPEDYCYYIENSEIFNKAGFNIEIFGENTISIREVPLILGKPEINKLFLEILDNLKNMGSGKTPEVKYNTIAKLACKSAVKANNKLSLEEMKSLINELRFIDNPFTCPHGRPTIIKLTLYELEKRFKRVQ
ncbi:DNA mismatch repair endonuclease MutL [Clostridium peptidivorans]|uniref:DNA mismatch repair endonuclease MutL n=1 Tax=Clostridium peptidivorans TaxID=100174 RepID=UPI0015CAE22C|nr:DNA mismatch repair endonuclease MutL [Clostridium peptidivorans]